MFVCLFSIIEKIVLSIIKLFFFHCRWQISFSKLQHSNTEIMPGDRDRKFVKSGFKRRLFRGGVVGSWNFEVTE